MSEDDLDTINPTPADIEAEPEPVISAFDPDDEDIDEDDEYDDDEDDDGITSDDDDDDDDL